MPTGYTRDVLIPLRMIQADERVDFHARATAEVAADEIERMRSTLNTLAMQQLTDEMDEDTRENADYEYGYNAMVRVARGAVNQ